MQPDLWALYGLMLKSRRFEEAVTEIWQDGLISGEMHLGMGEEAVTAGILAQLQDGDALALDHRGTPPLIMRGVDPVLLLKEFLGQPDGLCDGMGGHMHLFSKEHLAASSGIVGAAGPTAAGFALAGQMLRPGIAAVAFFGEGAMNQGMLMESMNLAVAWKLPVLFACKDNQWAITTRSPEVTGGILLKRAGGFGLYTLEVDGLDVLAVWQAAHDALERVRAGEGPAFLLAHCVHLEGHFLGDALLEITKNPVKSFPKRTWPMVTSLVQPGGAPPRVRMHALQETLGIIRAAQIGASKRNDPLARTRKVLVRENAARLRVVEEAVGQEINAVVKRAIEDITINREGTKRNRRGRR